MSDDATHQSPVIPLPAPGTPAAPREPLLRHLVGGVLRRERRAQGRTLKDVADAARISMPYLSEVERGRKEASSEVLAAAAQALGLGLADLLALAQGELVRHAAVRGAGRRTVRSLTSVTSVAVPGTGRHGAGAASPHQVRLAA